MTEKYRKKPVEVEVIKFDRSKWSREESQEKASETFPMVVASIGSGFKTVPVIETLEGDMKVSDGDYIIKGVQGEFYPCKPDIFHETYEPVSDHQPTFEVGEYYASKTGIVFKITSKTTKEEIAAVKSLVDGEIIDGMIDTTEIMFRYSKPSTAEEIAEFKRAEHFEAHGRKLDEFRAGDKVQLDGRNEVIAIESIGNDFINGQSEFGNSVGISMLLISETHLIQTAEELREVEDNAD